ncbi:MAG: hypothetical protein AAF378_09620 [Cyanobacteria bacterium P01_A01_bin.84]
MSILTQNSNNNFLLVMRVNKQKLVDTLFSSLLLSTLNSNVYIQLVYAMQRKLDASSTRTRHTSNSSVITEAGGASSGRYKAAMSLLKKLGMFHVHDGYIHLNPLVLSLNNDKPYEDVITYYSRLWSEEFKASFQFPFYIDGGLPTIQTIKDIVITKYSSWETKYTYERLLNLIDNDIEYSHLSNDEIRLQAKMKARYRNYCYAVRNSIAYTQLLLLADQLNIFNIIPGDSLYEIGFTKLSTSELNKVTHFSKTETYLSSTATYTLCPEDLEVLAKEYFDDFIAPLSAEIEATRQQYSQPSTPIHFSQEEPFTVTQPMPQPQQNQKSTLKFPHGPIPLPYKDRAGNKYNKFSLYLIEQCYKNNPSASQIEQLSKDLEASENWLGIPQRLPSKCRHLATT